MILLQLILSTGLVIPQAPVPKPVETPREHKIRMSLISGASVARMYDWKSTEKGLTLPYWKFHEGELPAKLVASKPAFAGYLVGVSFGEMFISNRIARKHPKLAITFDALCAAGTTATVFHNYYLIRSK